MARCQTTVSLLSAVILLSALSVSAQTTGSIRGRTVDDDGQALPGVTIVVTGEVLGSAQRTAVTSASGGFSFPAMPIGTFKVTATLDGYQTQAAEEVRVAIGKVASARLQHAGGVLRRGHGDRRGTDHRRGEPHLQYQISISRRSSTCRPGGTSTTLWL